MAVKKLKAEKIAEKEGQVLANSDVIKMTIDESEYTIETVNNVVRAYLSNLRKCIVAGDKISIIGLGIFSSKLRPARKGRNPITGETVDISPKHAIHFKVSSTLKKDINS